MARVKLAARAGADLARLAGFLLQDNPEAAVATFDVITSAVDVLESHLLIGRPLETGLRELVISRGKSGYVALYEFRELEDTVFVLAIRHQREVGYED